MPRRRSETAFRAAYRRAYPEDARAEAVPRALYARRKWRVLRSMTEAELLHDFAAVLPDGLRGKAAILRALRGQSWRV